MKQKKGLILLAAALVLVLVLALVAYRYFSENYRPEQPELPASDAEQQVVAAVDFAVLAQDGSSVKLSDYFGRPIVLNFWATWCGPCKSELPMFDAVAARYAEDVQFMMINVTDGQRDTVEGAQAFVEEEGYDFPLFFDTELMASMIYGANSIPLTVLIDAQGNIFAGQYGVVDEQALVNAIEELLNRAVE